MSDTAKIIETILSSLDGGAEFVYRDEPIIATAAQRAAALPEKYREMRRIGSSDPALLINESRLFVEQAKFMEDFEDSFEYNGTFMRYFPTYRHMSDRQLRGYFSWRTEVRRGNIRETSLSFAFLYLYELINLVGTENAEDAIEKLDRFVEGYSVYDRSIRRYAQRWRHDMAVYYGVSSALSGSMSPEEGFAAAAKTLSSPHYAEEDRLFEAIVSLSSFNPEKSKLYKKHPDETKALICRIFTAFSDFCAEHRKVSLAERLFGRKKERTYVIFPSAVFYDRQKYREYEFVSAGGRVYKCKNGSWSVTGYPDLNKKSSELGALIKSVDASIRPYFGIDTGESTETSRILNGIVEKEIAAFFEERRRAEAKKIRFDFSKLDGIRASADSTAKRLVTEDDADLEDDFPSCNDTEAESEIEPEEQTSIAILSDEEIEVLSMVLDGKDAAEYARSHGKMVSVIIDSINEKLFDMFLDNVLEFEGDSPAPVEDYTEDLKGLISQ